jgi:hypothetical protein
MGLLWGRDKLFLPQMKKSGHRGIAEITGIGCHRRHQKCKA